MVFTSSTRKILTENLNENLLTLVQKLTVGIFIHSESLFCRIKELNKIFPQPTGKKYCLVCENRKFAFYDSRDKSAFVYRAKMGPRQTVK